MGQTHKGTSQLLDWMGLGSYSVKTCCWSLSNRNGIFCGVLNPDINICYFSKGRVCSTGRVFYVSNIYPVFIYFCDTLKHSELLKVADVQTHICAKLSRICAKFVLLNAKQEKQALFYDLGTIWQNSLSPFLYAKFSVRKFSLRK